jgi:Zn-dependent protease
MVTIVLYAAVIAVSLAFHEFGHAYIAYKNGDSTAKLNGRMTLNPLNHIDPFGFVMLLVIGFGFAKPVPVNFSNIRNRRGIFFVAVAGVTINLLLAAVFAFFYVLTAGVAGGSAFVSIIGLVCYMAMWINIALVVFNLLPIYPLDGFRVAEAVTRRGNKFTEFMRAYGQYILLGLIIWGLVIDQLSRMFPASAYALRYFDVLGFIIGGAAEAVGGWLVQLWSLIL